MIKRMISNKLQENYVDLSFCRIGEQWILYRLSEYANRKKIRKTRMLKMKRHCVTKGNGVKRNPTEAVKRYRKAADQGHADAKKALEQLEGN